MKKMEKTYYETALTGTTTGKYDLDSGCKFRTPATEEAFLVSSPYNYFFMNLVVKNDSGIKSLEDMNGKSIASIVATDGRAVALNDWLAAHPDIAIDFEPLAASGAMADEIAGVEDGVYDAAYLSAEQANAILEEAGYTDLDITDRVDGRDTAFLIYKENTELQEAVNKAMSTAQGLMRIVIPQAVVISLPNMSNYFMWLLKATSLASVVNVFELLSTARASTAVNYAILEGYLVAAGIYWVVCIVAERGLNYLNKKMNRYQKQLFVA